MFEAHASGGMSALAIAQVSQLQLRRFGRVDAGDAMFKVVQEMKATRRGAVVVEDQGVLVGMFTERDLMSRLDHSDVLWQHTTVRDVMTPHPTAIHPDDSVAEALSRLVSGRRRHMPIVDDKGAVLGLLSIRDILGFIARKFPEEMINLPPAPDHEA